MCVFFLAAVGKKATATVPEARASHDGGGGGSLPLGLDAAALSLRSSLRSSWSRGGVRSETVLVTAQPSWRIVGRWFCWSAPIGWWGLACGRNPRRFVRLRCGDTSGCHYPFLEGVGSSYPLPPSAYWGKPKDLFGQQRRRCRIPSWRCCLVRGSSEPWAVVVCFRRAQRSRVIRALSSCRCWHFFFGLVVLLAPALRCVLWWFALEYKAGGNPFSVKG